MLFVLFFWWKHLKEGESQIREEEEDKEEEEEEEEEEEDKEEEDKEEEDVGVELEHKTRPKKKQTVFRLSLH